MNFKLQQLPNLLTLMRLGLIPVFVLLMLGQPDGFRLWCAIAVFILAAATDFADGVIARKFGAVSNLGKLLDPLADKILVMAALVMLLVQRSQLYGEPWVPGWMVVIILGREFWVTGLRAVAASSGRVIAAANAGKIKSLLQMVAIVLLLMHDYLFSFLGFTFTAQAVGVRLLFLSILLSLLGAYEYTREVFQSVLSEPPKNP